MSRFPYFHTSIDNTITEQTLKCPRDESLSNQTNPGQAPMLHAVLLARYAVKHLRLHSLPPLRQTPKEGYQSPPVHGHLPLLAHVSEAPPQYRERTAPSAQQLSSHEAMHQTALTVPNLFRRAAMPRPNKQLERGEHRISSE
ncbi:hypothetical protein TGVEG_442500 [Toxoplasma gondii VEG]|uniref:Uncharacterized protein n=1 Tax=Toxoplasma gondii (strain ATCC 50861 / VEG) TaxID=432359 RepID=V5AWC4_TOXGV|nr:hypothetical protein TGVEG_442500 [Toxoplasma gondii VEG]